MYSTTSAWQFWPCMMQEIVVLVVPANARLNSVRKDSGGCKIEPRHGICGHEMRVEMSGVAVQSHIHNQTIGRYSKHGPLTGK